MMLTFAETHNMVACLSKSDASGGFNQIINFLNGSSIKYALTVNPNIYVSYIKQFWTTVAVKKCMSAKRTSWNEFNSSMASAVICLSSGDLSTHTTKYTSPVLTQKVFANMRQVGKGFSGVETPLFEGMLVAQEVGEGVADEVHDEGVPAGGVTTEGDVSAAHDEVPTADEEPSIPSPTPPTPPPQPSQEIPSTSQVQPTPPQSPQAKEDPGVKRYQALKRKPQTEAQARKNMMIYIKNVAGFKMDYFKGMSYDDIPKKAAKRQKLDEEVKELKRHLQIVPNEDDDVYTEATPLARKSLVKERFATTKPKNFSDNFLLITLEAMFEKPDIHAQIWKNQRSVHGPAKVKGWKLLESCSVQIITFTTTQVILLVEKKYPLTRFTLDQMLNVVRLKVEEESEVSLELLRFIRQQNQKGAQLE
nr:hypothetical protein [Tanacetum cinerariifolium]